MSKYIKIFAPDTAEYARLTEAARRMTERSPLGCRYCVADTYFDFGRGWAWTTIICENHSKYGHYQALYPAQHQEILTGDLDTAIDNYFNGKYCLDRIDESRIDSRNRSDLAGLFTLYPA